MGRWYGNESKLLSILFISLILAALPSYTFAETASFDCNAPGGGTEATQRIRDNFQQSCPHFLRSLQEEIRGRQRIVTGCDQRSSRASQSAGGAQLRAQRDTNSQTADLAARLRTELQNCARQMAGSSAQFQNIAQNAQQKLEQANAAGTRAQARLEQLSLARAPQPEIESARTDVDVAQIIANRYGEIVRAAQSETNQSNQKKLEYERAASAMGVPLTGNQRNARQIGGMPGSGQPPANNQPQQQNPAQQGQQQAGGGQQSGGGGGSPSGGGGQPQQQGQGAQRTPQKSPEELRREEEQRRKKQEEENERRRAEEEQRRKSDPNYRNNSVQQR